MSERHPLQIKTEIARNRIREYEADNNIERSLYTTGACDLIVCGNSPLTLVIDQLIKDNKHLRFLVNSLLEKK